MTNVLWIGLGGGIGSMARYLVSLSIATRASHEIGLATFIVNIVGSFLIGYFSSMAETRTNLSPTLVLFLTTGILGGFTTFSAFGLETFQILKSGRTGIAVGYALGSLVFGVLAVFLGRSLA